MLGLGFSFLCVCVCVCGWVWWGDLVAAVSDTGTSNAANMSSGKPLFCKSGQQVEVYRGRVWGWDITRWRVSHCQSYWHNFCWIFCVMFNQLRVNGHPSKNTGKRNMRLCRLSSQRIDVKYERVLEKSAVVVPVIVSLLAQCYQNNSQVWLEPLSSYLITEECYQQAKKTKMPLDTVDRSTTDCVTSCSLYSCLKFALETEFGGTLRWNMWRVGTVSIGPTSAKSDGYLCEQDGSQAHLPGQTKHEMHLYDSTELHSAWLARPNSQKVTSETLLWAV